MSRPIKKSPWRARPSRHRREAVPTPGLLVTAASLIEGDTRKRLDAFCIAHDGANPDTVVIHAINDYITRNLDANKGVFDRFNQTQP